MKILVGLFLLSSISYAAPTASKKILPVTKEDEMVKKDKIAKEKLKMLDKKTEDCDDKAKKPVEIKPESISLSGAGAAGCTLDEAH